MAIKWTTNKIRQTWLDFWKSKDHYVVPSKSLIPVNDPSLIWINSGVATLKKYFSGIENPPANRLTNSQKAIRTNDIENVGLTSRHHTFFEMLGNFSIGDYFKKEAIQWGFELLTKAFGFSLDKLYFTVYEDDQDAFDAWVKCGVDPSHIAKCGRDRNFWDVGSGPCGPCTEIYYDRGQKYDPKNIGIELFQKDIENDRYVEIWNIVFSQFNNDGKNNYTELAHKNIDTGCGLERLVCVLQDTYTNFEIDIYQNIIQAISKLTKFTYKPDNYFKPTHEQTMINYAFRIIADHIKACSFAIADGAIPGNTGRGYIIRKLARRAIVYAHKLEIQGSFIKPVVEAVVASMKDFYPYLEKEMVNVISTLEKEESQFNKTLKKGMDLFDHAIKSNAIAGDIAFKLLDTYGFPIELTLELAGQKNVKVDMVGFKKCQEQHSKVSKTNAPAKAMAVQNATLMDFKKESFFDYDSNECDATIIGLFDENFNIIEKTIPDKHNWIVLDKTVVYANCGGEVADWAWIEVGGKKLKVYDAIKGPNGQHFHSIIAPKDIALTLNTKVHVSLDLEAKAVIEATHTTEHLIQAALQKTISTDIKQMGALKTHYKLTFDFQYPKKLTPEELNKAEALINQWIKQAIPVTIHHKTLDEAKAMGALAYFEEVYAKVKGKLRVVQVGDVSTEICAGRHVKNTKDIQEFHFVKLESKGSGAWRVESIASTKNTKATINELNSELQTKLDQIKKEIELAKFDDKQFINKLNQVKLVDTWLGVKANIALIDQLSSQFFKALALFKKESSNKLADKIANETKVDPNQKVCVIELDNIDPNAFAILPPRLTNKYPQTMFVIVNIAEKISYIITKNPSLKEGNARDLINEINKLTNGKGGGKDFFTRGSCDNTKQNLEVIRRINNEKDK